MQTKIYGNFVKIIPILFNFGHIRRWDQCAVYILYYKSDYRGIQGITGVYRGLQGYTRVYRGKQNIDGTLIPTADVTKIK